VRRRRRCVDSRPHFRIRPGHVIEQIQQLHSRKTDALRCDGHLTSRMMAALTISRTRVCSVARVTDTCVHQSRSARAAR
jgi:hypothetical protein